MSTSISVVQDSVTNADERLLIANLTVQLARKDGPVELLHAVSLDLRRGTVLGLIGESGSGKTMTCRAVVGALPHGAAITDGEVRVGHAVLRRAQGKIDKMAPVPVAMVFADPHASLDPLQRVGAQIAEMAHVHQRLRPRAARKEALRLLAQVLLPDPERTYSLFPFQLSGGMAQRAMIASVLAAKPHFLLADEPTSALDATVQLEILDLLARIVREENVGILLTTHDMAVASRTCDRIAVMYAGKIVEIGPARTVLAQPQHPYTRLLLQSRPRGSRATRLTAIPGEAPIPGEKRTPCPFAPRCPYAETICFEEEPLLVLRGEVASACHLVGRLPEANA